MSTRNRYPNMLARLIANSVLTERGCWLWTGPVRNGRPCISVRVPGQPHPATRNAGRVLLEEWLGYEFPHDEVGHWACYDPMCISPTHTRVETKAENLSGRRGYAPCKGSWIPTLYPTQARLDWEAYEHILTLPGTPVGPDEPCPF